MRRRGLLARRHRWDRSTVSVPWSDLPGNLYTCRKCRATRQSIPAGVNRWKLEFGLLQPNGDRRYLYGRTPPCEPRASEEAMTRAAQLLARSRNLADEIEQLFIDAEHWNRLHPDLAPINPDEDGVLRLIYEARL